MAAKGPDNCACIICGRGFHELPSRIKQGRGRYCGAPCYNAARRKKVSVTCEACGRLIQRSPSKIGVHTFCSLRCSNGSGSSSAPLTVSDDGLTARIPLCRRDGSVGAYALIDATDVPYVAQWSWHLNKHGYAERAGYILLHRELLGLKRGDDRWGDHINGDRLDDRRNNLRILTARESAQNKQAGWGVSQYRGVSWSTRYAMWEASCWLNGKAVYRERFSDEQEAAEAAKAARIRFLPFATT